MHSMILLIVKQYFVSGKLLCFGVRLTRVQYIYTYISLYKHIIQKIYETVLDESVIDSIIAE